MGRFLSCCFFSGDEHADDDAEMGGENAFTQAVVFRKQQDEDEAEI